MEQPKRQNQKDTRVRQFDLEKRTATFSASVRRLVTQLSKTTWNIEDGKQLIRASGSVGANYIEANESLGRKDFVHHLRICRKEVKESRYWLKLVSINNTELERERALLIQEATELLHIFNAGIRTIEGKNEK
jgi:four helix bundle protein